MTKYLVIAALLALLLLLLYSRLYPYIQALKKIFGVARTITDSRSSTGYDKDNLKKSDQKLVRCVGCGTWVPAERAIAPKAGLAVYCSRECLEKPAASDRGKAAS